jgi:hypothetical protein
MMEHFTLPDIFCPFPSQISPYVQEVHVHSLWWVKHFRLVQQAVALRRFSAARSAWLAARTHPCAGFRELALICDWCVWLFMFDDQFDDGALGKQPERMQPVLEHLLEVVSASAASPQGPIAEALSDFWQRAARYTNTNWQRRFVRDLAEYFDAYLWEAHNRLQEQVPAVDAYIDQRRRTGSLATLFDLIDISQRVDLPLPVYESQELQILRRTASNVVCWVNDLYSLRKELARGEINNLVVVLQHAHNSSLQEAVDRAGAMIEEEVRLFLDTEQQLPACSPALDQDRGKYLTDLRAWMRGSLDWSRETPRYSQIEYTTRQQSVSYLENILPL